MSRFDPDLPADDRIILPIGHHVASWVADGGQVRREVRVGPEVHELDEPRFQAWTLAHGGPDALRNDVPWRRESVIAMMRHSGALGDDRGVDADSAAELVDELIDDGLLAEVSPEAESAVAFAEQHRVTPLMPGLGNSADEPDLFGIGLLDRPAVRVDFVTYDLWQWSAMDETIWATCESAADVAERSGAQHLNRLDPRELLTDFLESLHALLIVRAACVDLPFRLARAVGA